MTSIAHNSRGVGLRLPADLYDRLRSAASERQISLNWMIVRLLSESMERLIPVDELRLTRAPTNGRSEP